jgi:membrane fusion protein, multidrug efflux system
MKIKGSYIWAFLIAAVVGGWLYSGELVIGGQSNSDGNSEAEPGGVAATAPTEQDLFQVRVRTFQAAQRTAQLVLRGRTQTEARVNVKAETPGLVDSIPVSRGQRVEAGDILCRIEPGAREATLLEANARLEQAKLDHEALAKLQESGYAADTRVRALKAQVDAAQAAVTRAELDLKRIILRAPFAGVVEHDNAEIGDYLDVGRACITIVALDPMLVVGQVSERDISSLDVGMEGVVKFITGETLPGQIRFISPSADADTRTFRVELVIQNLDYEILDNITADIMINLTPVKAQRFTAAILTLNDDGEIGVKAVGPDNVIEFMPVTILGDTREGVWVAGLPETVTLVTVGQEYVVDGQRIDPIPDDGATLPESVGQ